ncbi:deaminase [Spongiactinospora sp. TRM90649]|uniref:deaminase n=1 Tax=Spongiactinospora sp. TRM90649 TaxID=3031114 RepID=UPI0023F6E9A4|nr:deaminase [Spongiactinospora sp. TRM90649]MDF5758999.1 deaminase [Spongiactinospora sp. TRM90649]
MIEVHDAAWERVLDLAWEGFAAGSTPVGAVAVDAAGAIVAEGRGRRHETDGPPGRLAGSHIAHAEVNALAGLVSGRRYDDHGLLTSLEPCGMCHGAAVQATVGAVHYAGADPFGGTGHLVFDTPQARRRPLRMHGPLPGERGRFAVLLHISWLLRLGAEQVVEIQRAALPEETALAERAEVRSVLEEAVRDAATAPAVRRALGPVLS